MATQLSALTLARSARSATARLSAALHRWLLRVFDPLSATLAIVLRFAYLFELLSRLGPLQAGNSARAALWLIGLLLFSAYVAPQAAALARGSVALEPATVARKVALDLLFFSYFFIINGDHESNLIYAFLLPLIFAANYLSMVGAMLALGGALLLFTGSLGAIWLTTAQAGTSFADWMFSTAPPMHNAPWRVLFISGVLLCACALPGARARQLNRRNQQARLRYHRLTRLLAERSRSLARGDDIENLVAITLQAARDEVPCEAVSLFLYNPRTGRYERRHDLGLADSYLGDESYTAGQGLTGKVVNSAGAGFPVRENNVRSRRDACHEHLDSYARYLPSGRTEQLLAVPLQGSNRAFGILRAVNKRLPSGAIDPLGFSSDDQDLLAALAALVALAYCARRRTEKAEAVFDVNATLAQTMDSDQVCLKLAEVIVRDGFAACCVLLSGPNGELSLTAGNGLTTDQSTVIERLGALAPVRAAVIESRHPCVSPDLFDDPDPNVGSWMRAAGLRSALRLPLIHHGAAIGVLEIYSATCYEFYAESVASLTLIATQAAAAISSARLAAHSQQQIQTLTKLTAIVVRLMRYDDEQQLFDDAVHRLAALFQAEDCSLFWVNRDQQTIDLQAASCIPHQLFRGHLTPISAENQAGLVAYVAATRQPLQFVGDSFRQHPAWSGSYREHLSHLPSRQCVSLLLQPIFNQENELVGVLKLENKLGVAAAEGFSRTDRELAELLATQVSLGVEKIRRIRKLALLHDIAEQICVISERREVLRRIATAARAVLAADRVVICPFDPEHSALAPEQAVVISATGGTEPPPALGAQLALAALLIGKDGARVIEHPHGRGPDQMAATIAVALRGRAAPAGVLLFDFRTCRRYSQLEIGDAETFGKFAAVAIQDANLFAEATRVTRELEAMQTLTQTALATGELRLERVIDVVLDTIHGALGYDFCAINLVNDAEGSIHGEGARGIACTWIGDSNHSVSSSDIHADVIRTGKTEILIGWDKRLDRAIYERYGHARLVRVFTPIRGRDRYIGTVEAGFHLDNRPAITQAETETLRRYVNQVALVIDCVRQLDQSRRYAKQMSDMHTLARSILQFDPCDRSEQIVERAKGIIAALIDHQPTIEIRLCHDDSAASQDCCAACPAQAAGQALTGACHRILAEGDKAIFAGGVWVAGRQQPFACVPVRLGSETLGVLCAHFSRDHWFSDYEREFLGHCAAQIAAALINARSQRQFADERDWLEGEIDHFYHDLLGNSVSNAIHTLECLSKGLFGTVDAEWQDYSEQTINDLALVHERIVYLLELRRADHAMIRLELAETAVAPLVERCVQRIQRPAYKKSIAVSCHIEPDCAGLTLNLDHERIGAAIDNLLRNAVKYTPTGGRVDARISRHGGTLRIDVEDTGIGIDPAFHQRIFEKYYQLDTTPGTTRSGLGLGLSIALHFVKLHAGRIEVQSREEHGTRFRIALPIPGSGTPSRQYRPSPGTGAHGGLFSSRGATSRRHVPEEADHGADNALDRGRGDPRHALRPLVPGPGRHRSDRGHE